MWSPLNVFKTNGRGRAVAATNLSGIFRLYKITRQLKAMKFFITILFLISLSIFAFAQTGEILATANNQNFTVADLPQNIRENYENLPRTISNLRAELFAQQIADILLKDEAAARKTTVEKLVEAEMQKRVPNPTEAQIKAVYDANRESIGEKSATEVRPQIVAFLRRDAEQKALTDFVESLKTKYSVAPVKDVNAPLLQPTDILANINGKQILARDFEEKAGEKLYDARAGIYEQTEDALEQIIFSAILSAEAKKLGVQPEDIIAREITDRMRDFSADERDALQANLQKKFFEKYTAKILLKEPAPFVRKIAILPANASRGSANAPVTVVMFTDFQCPACSATHPVLQKILAEYPADKVRFVVRDFPLTQIHNNSLLAAQAAAAANAQGKFFEYTEILYKNQNNLDAASLKKYADDLGLNRQKFAADFDGGRFAADVKKDMADGESYGIDATPTIYVNGVKVRQLSAAGFRRAIDRALKN